MSITVADVRVIVHKYNYIKADFPGNSPRKNLFITVCAHIHDSVDLDIVDYDCKFGGLIGMGNSKLDIMLKYFKIFRVHACLHDAYGYMKTKHNKGPGYNYVTHLPINSPLLGDVSGLSYCLYLKIIQPSVYVSIPC